MSYKTAMHNIYVNVLSQCLHNLFCVLLVLILLLFTFSSLSLCSIKQTDSSASAEKWVGTWTTAPQLVETSNNPPSPGLSNNTLRQIVCVSLGGDSLRIRFSNEFSTHPVTLNEVHIAISEGGSTIDTSTNKVLYFNGNPRTTIEPGAAITSDPFQFSIQPRTNIAITIYFGETSPDVTGHPGSRTTSYLLTGNEVSEAEFSGAVQADHWYIINSIDVMAPDSAAAVVTLGNSITDGRGSGTNKQDRWPDELAIRLQGNPNTRQVAVLNQGIGGNCVLRFCLGPSALSRFNRDVLEQSGVKWLIILEGINDIGGANGAQGSVQTAQNLISAYGQMIDSAHANGILVYGATLLPFGGSSYDSPDHQKAWKTVNDWIRNSGRFDAVIDFDKALRDSTNPAALLPIYDSGDHLHPSETGHFIMAAAIDLTLFEGNVITGLNEKSAIQPNTFSLLQNYPNPFSAKGGSTSGGNPATTIEYIVGKSGNIKITIYDVKGREVETIVNGFENAGVHRIIFNANNLPSGIYFYRLTGENNIQTKSMILLK
jgi:lysophospholipase L1-like esterase